MSDPSSDRSRSSRFGRQATTAPCAKDKPTIGMVKPCQAGSPRRASDTTCTPPLRATAGGHASTSSAYASSARTAVEGSRLDVTGVTGVRSGGRRGLEAILHAPRAALLGGSPFAALLGRFHLERFDWR